jgi:hypothetical protein
VLLKEEPPAEAMPRSVTFNPEDKIKLIEEEEPSETEQEVM